MGWMASILRRLHFSDTSASPKDLIESWPLRDVLGYAATHGVTLKNSDDFDSLLQTFGPALQADLEWKNSPCYPAPYIAELKDVAMIPGCRILLNAEGSAMSDEVELGFRMFGLRPKLWDMEITDGPHLNFKSIPSAPSLIPSGIHMTGEHESNYFHWIVEVLPRLFMCERLLSDKQIPILVTEGLHDNLYTLLDCIRAPQRAVLKLKKSYSYPIARLIYPSDLTRILDTYDRAPGQDTTYLPVLLLREMAARIKSTLDATASTRGKSIYIKRSSIYRRLLNEPEIERLMTEQGFEVIDPGQLTIKEQISVFSHCEAVVGPSGAAMANMLWCCPGTRIIILHSNHPFKKYPYWDAMARACEAQITYLAGPRAHSVTGVFEAHDDFNINTEELLSTLENSRGGRSQDQQLIKAASTQG